MSLRRFAQSNAAASGTPRTAESSVQASPSTPSRNGALPATPRTRIVYPISPLTSPSLSASTPFDWEAARAHKPPPYPSPLARKRQSLVPNGTPNRGSPKKRVVRKRGIIERIQNIPSAIAFEISQFPNNLPLPSPKKSAWILGGTLHFTHLCVRISQIRKAPESDVGWEVESEPWFDWTAPVTLLLLLAAVLNTIYLFSRTRIYHLNLASDKVSSPHASFVPRSHTPTSPDPPPTPIYLSVLRAVWRALVVSFRFLLNLNSPQASSVGGGRIERVQQLEMWTPGEIEMMLFTIYSPVHSLLWIAFSGENWMLMMVIMAIVSGQMRVLTRTFEALVKDKSIIAREVMHEYDEKFVYPRIMPIRKDAAVMTHESEVVNIHERRRDSMYR